MPPVEHDSRAPGRPDDFSNDFFISSGWSPAPLIGLSLFPKSPLLKLHVCPPSGRGSPSAAKTSQLDDHALAAKDDYHGRDGLALPRFPALPPALLSTPQLGCRPYLLAKYRDSPISLAEFPTTNKAESVTFAKCQPQTRDLEHGVWVGAGEYTYSNTTHLNSHL